ncbi:MAG TPA: hypothetical protein VLC74_11350 [Rhizomicrobium sp.]|nr:hypothetical protein [Rhizomicrobium sp.]
MQAHSIETYAGHVIGQKGEIAAVLCVTYSLDSAGQNNAALFGQIGSNFPALTMPSGRALTFPSSCASQGQPRFYLILGSHGTTRCRSSAKS